MDDPGCALRRQQPQWLGIPELGGEDGQRRRYREGRMVCEEVVEAADGAALAAEVIQPLGPGAQLVRPLAEHPVALGGLSNHLLTAPAPGDHLRRGLIVPDGHVLQAEGVQIIPGLLDAASIAVVDGQSVNVLADPGVEHLEAEVPWPQPSGQHGAQARDYRARRLDAGLAELHVVADGIRRPAGADLIEPFPPAEPALVVLAHGLDHVAEGPKVAVEHAVTHRAPAGHDPGGRIVDA